MNDYYTHQDYLESTISSLDFSKPLRCLEFGVGNGSSTLFNKYANLHENLFIDSFEFDLNWFIAMKKKYELKNYQFHYLKFFGDIDFNKLKLQFYDLIFLDQGDWASRIDVLNNLKHTSNIFILHDYDYYNKGVCENTLYTGPGSFFDTYLTDFKLTAFHKILPPTLLFNKL